MAYSGTVLESNMGAKKTKVLKMSGWRVAVVIGMVIGYVGDIGILLGIGAGIIAAYIDLAFEEFGTRTSDETESD